MLFVGRILSGVFDHFIGEALAALRELIFRPTTFIGGG
jgi:hypothetical protein